MSCGGDLVTHVQNETPRAMIAVIINRSKTDSAIIRIVKSVLDGIRVVEMTEALAGPYCAMLLGDLGADVIKVERPGIGDQARGWGPPFVGELSAYFLSTNRNKRSIVLDYNQANGLEVLHKLIAVRIFSSPISHPWNHCENDSSTLQLCVSIIPN